MNNHFWNKWGIERSKVLTALLTGTVAVSAFSPALAEENTAGAIPEQTDASAVEQPIDVIAETAAPSEAELQDAVLASSQNILKNLGLVKATGNGFVTRRQAVVMAVRLTGEAETALKSGYSHPFTDVGSNCQSYIGYAYYTGLAKGVSATKFGVDQNCSARAYMTYVLKALGYHNVTTVNCTSIASSIGLCTSKQAAAWCKQPLSRQSMAEITYLALNTKIAGQSCTLAKKLVCLKVIDEKTAHEAGVKITGAYVEVKQPVQKATVTKAKVSGGIYTIRNNRSKKAISCSSTAKQADVVVRTNESKSTQKFKIIKNANSTFQIKSTASNYYLDATPFDGSDVLAWKQNGTDCQTFCAVKTSVKGYYSIRVASNPKLALTQTADGDLVLKNYSGSSSQMWMLSNGTEEDTSAAAAKLASIMTVHPDGKSMGSSYSFAGASQCMAFGREVFSRMYGTTARWNYNGTGKSSSDSNKFKISARTASYSSSSVKSTVTKAKPGDILQMNTPKMHTMVFVSSDSKGFTVYDCNWTGSNRISIRHVNYSAWNGRNSSGMTVLHSTNYPKL